MKAISYKKGQSSILLYLYRLFILWGYIVECPIAFGLTTRRVSITVAIISVIVRSTKTKAVLACIDKKKVQKLLVLFLFCTIFTFVHSLNLVSRSPWGQIEYWYYLFILMYVFLFAIYCVVEYDNFQEFAKVLLGVILLESISIYAALVSAPFRVYLYEHFFFSPDDRLENSISEGYRIMGIGISQAGGSLKMSIATIFLVALKMKNQISDFWFFVLYFIIFSATMFIGRTGTLVELSLFIFYFIHQVRSVKVQVLSIITILGVLTGGAYLLSIADIANSDMLIEWMLGAFDEERFNGTMEGIHTGGFPPLSLDTFLGTGLSVGYSIDGNTYYPDSGYIRMWICLGVFGFLAYYIAIYAMLTSPKIKGIKKDLRHLVLFVILIAFIVEYKEPFFMKYIFAWSIMILSLFLAKEKYDMSKINRN